MIGKRLTHDPGEAEVAQLDDPLCGEQYVLGLDIAVDTAVLVTVGHALQRLPADAPHLQHTVPTYTGMDTPC